MNDPFICSAGSQQKEAVMALHSIPNKTTKTGSKSRSLPDSAWPLCCTHSDEDHLTPLRVEKERRKKHRCRHDGDDRDWSTRRSLLTVSQVPFSVNHLYSTVKKYIRFVSVLQLRQLVVFHKL